MDVRRRNLGALLVIGQKEQQAKPDHRPELLLLLPHLDSNQKPAGYSVPLRLSAGVPPNLLLPACFAIVATWLSVVVCPNRRGFAVGK
ncbi:hypothetical protein GV794_22110 [Nocardia cyriacigeorgica]|uniref:Uncharacterized protein n=1 Tax=Nocardia cyriacigeorgica TaxID=135487 RepID=A0ABX0CQG0_9NOCA|nr:hypothetical protein [Nocardia cyriacigeorgica]